MRSMLFFKTKTPPSTQTQERGQFNSSTFRGTWRKPMHTDKLNAHAYRRRPLVYSVHILSTAKFPERLSNKQQTLFFNPQKQTSSPEGESIQMQSKCKQAQ